MRLRISLYRILIHVHVLLPENLIAEIADSEIEIDRRVWEQRHDLGREIKHKQQVALDLLELKFVQTLRKILRKQQFVALSNSKYIYKKLHY